MKTITKEQLKEVLEKHQLWLENKEGGERADLRGVDLRGADLRFVDLRFADLKGADLRFADLRSADLKGANLSYSDLSYSDLSYSDLRNANLRDANLRNTNLSYSDLRDANLRFANLRHASTKNTILENKSIVQFQFNQHTAYYYGQDEVTIGCEKHSISHWLANYEEIGKKHGYSEEEIKRYFKFIESCAKDYKENNK